MVIVLEKRYCVSCGYEIESSDTFCYNCGAKVDMERKGKSTIHETSIIEETEEEVFQPRSYINSIQVVP